MKRFTVSLLACPALVMTVTISSLPDSPQLLCFLLLRSFITESKLQRFLLLAKFLKQRRQAQPLDHFSNAADF